LLPRTERGKRSADRRSGAAAPVTRANDVGPQALARRLAPNNVGRSPLGAPQRGLWHSGPRATFEDHAPSNTCELLASARSGGGRVSGASRVLLARQRAGHRIPTCPCNASREHPRRSGCQDDMPTQASVKDFRRCAQRNGGHAVHSETRDTGEMPARRCFPATRRMHRKLRTVDSKTVAMAGKTRAYRRGNRRRYCKLVRPTIGQSSGS
jgi:hypothetical protein